MFRKPLLCVFLVAAIAGLSGFAVAFGASPDERTGQALLIKGREVTGVMVKQNGIVQSVMCPAPQPYVTADGTSTGWACLDPATGTWLMNAKTQSDTACSQPGGYPKPSTVYKYYSFPYPYPYPYYPYYYGGPFFWGPPSFTFGFGRPWP
jgi:hypothetical protein